MFSQTVKRRKQRGVEKREEDEEGEGSPWI